MSTEHGLQRLGRRLVAAQNGCALGYGLVEALEEGEVFPAGLLRPLAFELRRLADEIEAWPLAGEGGAANGEVQP